MSFMTTIRAAAVAAAAFGLVAAGARADECEAMTKSVKTVIDRFDPAAKGGNSDARSCAAFAEGLGLVKAFRVINDECLDEGEERTKTLADLDRKIRALQTQVDKKCE